MKIARALLLLTCLCVGAASAQSTLILADEGLSRYRIVLPSTPTEHESKAAEVLQKYLLEISGAALPIVSADAPASSYEILIGQNERLAEERIVLDPLGEDGYAIKTSGSRLIIAGGPDRGTLFGVYGFLEDHLGARMYTPKAKAIPKKTRIELGEIDDLQVPVITYRTTHYKSAWDAEYVDWHKLDHNEKGERPDWGMWVHTFSHLVPPEIHYDEHPEYYAMVDGKRIPTQLCLTNPDVLEITVRNLRREMAKKPDAKYWSVSQNDNRVPCQCDRCKAIDDREGSHSGTIINFVNQVAERFPDKVISTLAYEYSRKAPLTLRPADNVNIMLCSIEVTRDEPITVEPTSADFVRDVEEWGKIADDIIVWDYVIQFPNLVSPFPNLHVLQPNIKFFADHGVTAMFEQGNREVGGEFAELRAYLISKLLWNPDADVDALMDEFLIGYYGAAGPFIRTYIDEMTEALLASGEPLRIFGSPNAAATSYLTPALLDRYEALFDQAEAAVSADHELLFRVQIARMPVEFAIIEQAKKNYTGERGLFEKVNGRWIARADILSRIDPFTDLANRQGVTRVKEWSTPPEEYRSTFFRMISKGMNEHLAYGKKLTFNSPDSTRRPPEAAAMLTDGIRGGHDYGYNWLGISGQDLDVVIDLEEVREVRRIETAYNELSAWSSIFPKQVDYYVSLDGEDFERVGSVDHELPILMPGAHLRDFIADFEPRQARYVRVHAQSIGNTPAWHPGAGRPARILVDEIVVE